MITKEPVVICDLSDVLIKGLEGSEVAIAKELKLPVDEVRGILFSADYNSLWLGRVSEKDFFDELVNKLNWDIEVATLIKIIHDNFYIIPGVFEIYKQLHGCCTTILYSTNCKEWVNEMKSIINYSELFDKEYYSFTLGAHKKMEKGYRFILDQYPEKLTYLIDDSSSNIVMAEKLGIRGLHFKDAKQLERVLIRENIL